MGSALGAMAAAGLGDEIGGILSGLDPNATFSFAIATADPAAATNCGTSVFAIRVEGGNPNTILQLMIQEAAKEGGTTRQTSLGGKSITELVDDGSSKTYVYISGDTVFGVDANDDAAAGVALSELP